MYVIYILPYGFLYRFGHCLELYVACMQLALYAPFVSSQQVLDTICIVGNPSHLAVPATPGSTYNWSVKGGNILSGMGTNDVLVKWEGDPGFYTVSVTETDSNGCPGDPVEAVVYLLLPEHALIDGPDKVCRGEEVVLTGRAGPNFEWIGGKTKETLRLFPLNDTLIFLVALNGPCKNDTFYHRIEVVEPPIASIHNLPDTIRINTQLDFFYTGTTAEEVHWMINDSEAGSGYYLEHQFTRQGEQFITQLVKSGNCTDTLKRKVFVQDDFAVHIPNAFTPNGDGINDLFLFNGVGIKHYVAQIYNRWGNLVHTWTENDAVEGWDGTFNGQEPKQDSYLYKIRVFDFHGKEYSYQGHVTLIR
ncbi:MAG: T9SS type B sorting domain-containing protein [Owenweeksia sp.]